MTDANELKHPCPICGVLCGCYGDICTHECAVGTGKCYAPLQCCFCGAVHIDTSCRGYGGEIPCHVCGKGGQGEPDEPDMFARRVGGYL